MALCHPDRKHYCKDMCRECYDHEYKSARKTEQRGYDLQRRFGITFDQYNEMLAKQNGGCLICGKPEKSGRPLSVDHDHKTGRVRGLLCSNHNTAIGLLGDDPILALQAAAYLLEHKAQHG